MDIFDAIKYLKPIAESATLPKYKDALKAVISSVEELEFTRNFIHKQGLEYALLNEWNRRENLIADVGKKDLISRKALLDRIENTPVPEEYWHNEKDREYAKWLVETAGV